MAVPHGDCRSVTPFTAPDRVCSAMNFDGFGIDWQVSFGFPENALFDHPAILGALLDELGHTAWWREIDVLGHDAMPGRPVRSVAAAKKVIASGKRDVFVLASGEQGAAALIAGPSS